MRTGNINVQAVLAQAQAKLSGTTQQAGESGAGAAEIERLGKISPVLAQVHERIAAQSQTASASLSTLGQFKSDLFKLGNAAQGVQALAADSTPQKMQAALEKLVAAFNASLKSSAAVGSTDAGAGIGRAQRELRDAADGLAALGVARRQDGSLTLDASVLAKAVSERPADVAGTLAGVAERIAGISTRTLADDGRLSTSLTRLGNRAQALKEQQAAVASTATQLAQLQTAGSNWSALALAAYRRV